MLKISPTKVNIQFKHIWKYNIHVQLLDEKQEYTMVEQSLKWELESDVKKLKTPGIPIVTDTGERTNPIFPEIRTISGAERLFQFTISQNRPDFKCTSHVMLDHGAASFKGMFPDVYIGVTKLEL